MNDALDVSTFVLLLGIVCLTWLLECRVKLPIGAWPSHDMWLGRVMV